MFKILSIRFLYTAMDAALLQRRINQKKISPRHLSVLSG